MHNQYMPDKIFPMIPKFEDKSEKELLDKLKEDLIKIAEEHGIAITEEYAIDILNELLGNKVQISDTEDGLFILTSSFNTKLEEIVYQRTR